MPLNRSVSTSDLTRTVADEVAAYLEIVDSLDAIVWFVDANQANTVDLATAVCEIAWHARAAVDALVAGGLA